MEIQIMAHFAELDSNNVVLRVLVLDNAVMENEQGQRVEQIGIDFLQNLYGLNTIWKQTSYNTKAGIYYDPTTNEPSSDQSKEFRKNYAGIGYTYDQDRDAFINQKPDVPENMEQYVYFDEFSCFWIFEPPVVNPLTMEVTRV
jgi:hypothetical protein